MGEKKLKHILKAGEVSRYKLFLSFFVVLLLVATNLAALTNAEESKTSVTNDQSNNNLVGKRFLVKQKASTTGAATPTAKFAWKAFKFAFYTLLIVDGRSSTSNDGDTITKWRWRWDESDSYHTAPSYFYHFYRDFGKQMHKVWLEVTDSSGHISGATMHLVFARPYSGSHGTYSTTYISQYDNTFLDDLDGEYMAAQCTELKYILAGASWQERFSTTEGSVTEGTFTGSVPTSNFHYHCGHGIYDWTGDFVTEITLKGWGPLPNNNDVRPWDVNDKWNNNCKWVFLHSCHLLEDDTSGMPGHYTNYFRDQWAQALNDCHIILGFASVTYLDISVISNFFLNAMGNDYNVVQAYRIATTSAYSSSVKAAAIADTYDQWNDDHLYGQGTVQPDEESEDSTYYFLTWEC